MSNPSERFDPSASQEARAVAEGFGYDVERYDRTRPTYPAELVDHVAGLLPGPRLLDVGIGTGTSARPFRDSGLEVHGVEVDPRMAAYSRAQGFAVDVGRFEEWDPAGRTFDGVICGQAWHWVDPQAGAAKARSILVAGGWLAVFWNVGAPPPDLAEAFTAVYGRVLAGTPFARGTSGGLDAYQPLIDKSAAGLARAGGFEVAKQWTFDWTRTYSRAEYLDQVPTFGGHNQFSADVLADLLFGLGEAIDAVGGLFTMEYRAVVLGASRSSD